MTRTHTKLTRPAKERALSRLQGLLGAAVLACLIAGGIVLATASSAIAHDGLISTDPEADDTLTTSPPQITLTFSGELLDAEGASLIEVVGENGRDITDGEPTIEGTVLTQKLSEESGGGTFTVRWRVVSSDGHPISDEYSYTVNGPASPGTGTGTDSPTPGPEEAEQTPEQSPPPAEAAEGPGHGEPTGGGAFPPALFILGFALLLGGTAFAVILPARNRRLRRAAARTASRGEIPDDA